MVIQKPAALGNYEKGRRNRISRITFHHIVGDAASAIAKFQTPGVEVSATYVIGSDGQIYQCVSENDTAYCDSNPDSNSRTISIEHAGPPYAEAMYNASATLVADLIQRYGIQDFKRHRDVSEVPTLCPGSLDVERIINKAKEPEVKPTGKQIDDAINQARILAGFPESDLETFLKVYRPELQNNFVEGHTVMMGNLIKDPKSAINKPPEGLVPVGQLFMRKEK